MKRLLVLLFLMWLPFVVFNQGVTRYGQSTSGSSPSFVNELGRTLSDPSLTRYGMKLTVNNNSLLNGLTGYWQFDESSGNAIDSQGAHPGLASSVTYREPGIIGTSFGFNKDSRSYVYPGSFYLSTSSVSFWARRASYYNGECLVGFGGMHAGIWIGSDGILYLANSNGERVATWGVWTETSMMHHLVLVCYSSGSAGRVELFLDGVSRGSRNAVVPVLSDLVIGNEFSNGLFTYPSGFTGVIDEFGLWNRALSMAEIEILYNRGAGNTWTFAPPPSPQVTYGIMADVHQRLLHSNGNKMVIIEDQYPNKYIRYSSDNGLTFNTGIRVDWATPLRYARILDNGRIVVCGADSIYYSSDNLSTLTPCTVLGKDGQPYEYHDPVNDLYPGGYFDVMGGFVEYEGMAILGNYTNSGTGSSPVNLYYTLNGITWKVFYTFGLNPWYTDNGTIRGGTGGTLLGDPSNNLITRHIHSINRGYDGNYYVATGDGYTNEIHMMKCTYDSNNDSWFVIDLLNTTASNWQRMRALGIYEKDGYIYWGSDGPGIFIYDGVEYQCFGIYKCPVNQINDPSKHILLQPLTDACYSFFNYENIVMSGLQHYGSIFVSFDYGETWTEYAKPVWTSGSIDKVWYNSLHRYFGTASGMKINLY
ncbi:MAG: LamG-like jellyroll fold domain-containing protein [Bacteroidales bacterium]|jgi:hypothetical protein|nr:LamG-like jellyroll fold domain-containing protein [Bacteroidales bacterium]